jgi:hypothetical protein
MNGWLHYAPAAFTIPVGFGLMIAVDWLLNPKGGPDPLPCQSQEEIDASDNASCASQHSLILRLWPVLACLAAVFVAQIALNVHLRVAGPDSFPSLGAPLAALPANLITETGKTWQGGDRPDLDDVRKQLPFEPDDILLRDYRLAGTNIAVQVYAIHSRAGEDRKHHPEICIRQVTGAPEDPDARKKIALDADGKRQVQRFAFHTGSVGATTVYYWHYTFLAPTSNNSLLQTLHQRLGELPPSLTVQVLTTTDSSDELDAIEKDLLPALDAALSAKSLPSTAMIDSGRLPVALVR